MKWCEQQINSPGEHSNLQDASRCASPPIKVVFATCTTSCGGTKVIVIPRLVIPHFAQKTFPPGVAFKKPTDGGYLNHAHSNFTEVLQEEAAQPHVVKHCYNRSSYSRGVVLLENGSLVTHSFLYRSQWLSLPETSTKVKMSEISVQMSEICYQTRLVLSCPKKLFNGALPAII